MGELGHFRPNINFTLPLRNQSKSLVKYITLTKKYILIQYVFCIAVLYEF